jgi:hypothetical protein
MKRIRAKIVDGVQILLDDLEVWLHFEAPDSWRGDFALPRDKPVAGNSFRLIAEDGRQGEILISKVSPSNYGDTLFNFQGRGLFEQPAS